VNKKILPDFFDIWFFKVLKLILQFDEKIALIKKKLHIFRKVDDIYVKPVGSTRVLLNKNVHIICGLQDITRDYVIEEFKLFV
jgi:hypothetical protein